MEIYDLELIIEVYTLIKANKATRTQINDAYYKITQKNVEEHQRSTDILKWVENNYTREYQAAAEINNRRLNKRSR